MELNKENNRKFVQLSSQTSGVSFSLSSLIFRSTREGGFFIHKEILSSRKSASAPHYHKLTDEIVYVLKGKILAKEGKKKEVLEEGDAIFFEANSNLLHVIENPFLDDAEFLVIKQNFKNSDVIYQ